MLGLYSRISLEISARKNKKNVTTVAYCVLYMMHSEMEAVSVHSQILLSSNEVGGCVDNATSHHWNEDVLHASAVQSCQQDPSSSAESGRYSAFIHQQGLVLPQNDLVRMARSKMMTLTKERSTYVSESRIECLA